MLDFLLVHLPFAGVDVNPLLMFLLALLVGFLAGLFGVGGGFLMVPLANIVFKVPMNVTAGTSILQITSTAASGGLAHYRLGHVEWKLALLLLCGSIPGGWFGVHLINSLKETGMANLDYVTSVGWTVVVISTGLMLTLESLKTLRNRRTNGNRINKHGYDDEISVGFARHIHNLPIPPRIYFEKSGVTVPALIPVLTGFLVGTMAGFFGVGGGIIMMPILVYLLGIPTVVAIGTDLFQMVFTASNASIAHAMSGNIDYILALLMMGGAVFGAQLGARSSKIISGPHIRVVFGSIILSVGATLILKLLHMDELKIIFLSLIVLVTTVFFMYCVLMLLGLINPRRAGGAGG